MVAPGSTSPASCSTVKRSKGMLLLKASSTQSCQDESVDGIDVVRLSIVDLRNGRTLRRNERPVFLPLCALGEPAREEGGLLSREGTAGTRRHAVFDVSRGDALEQFAVVRL